MTDLVKYTNVEAWAAALTQTARNLHADVWRLAELLDGGEAQFGEAIYQYTDSLGLDYGYLRNLKWVAGVFPLSRRVTLPALPLSYFQEVAPLPDDEADSWLKLANEEGWSRATLRAKLREARKVTAPDPGDVYLENHALKAEAAASNGRWHALEEQVAALEAAAAQRLADDPGAAMTYPRGEDHAGEWLTGRCPECDTPMVCPKCGRIA